MNPYLAIARPDHWFKNIFVLPGIALAAVISGTPFSSFWLEALVGLASACAIASANYVINEWLDAEFDRHHPLKKNRPSVVAGLSSRLVWVEYAAWLALGLGLAWLVSLPFLWASALFALMGILYNVEPFRTKDRVYLDVLSESLNNPIRLLLGWFIVTAEFLPPSSLLLGYWMSGGFLMAVKRYAELRFIGDAGTAGLYRRSFGRYTEESLLVSAFFYGSCAAFFLGVFLVKHRVELLVCLPFLSLIFTWYLRIGMQPDSPAQRPEHLYREWGFAVCVLCVALLIAALFVVDVPNLEWFLHGALTSSS